jgi:hypothetical protein
MEDNQPRKLEGTRFELDDLDYHNLFGDMYIMQAAIYLEANIITNARSLNKWLVMLALNVLTSYQSQLDGPSRDTGNQFPVIQLGKSNHCARVS